MTERPWIVAIVGATATGKTAVALQVAESLQGEIVSVDSRLIYRGMDIGTAKPMADERARVPHHLIDVAEPNETWSLGRFQQAVSALIPEIVARQRLPILVGGTGQYMRAILEGWTPPPRPSDPQIRARLDAEAALGGGPELVERLKKVDPISAETIDARNLRRVVRALEIYEATGVPASQLRGTRATAFRVTRVGLTMPRPALYGRIDARIDHMIEAGLVAEVQGLLARGFSRSLPSMSAIGYREIAAHLAGEMTFDEAVRRMRRSTRSFVRRQANWFREGDPAIRWFTPAAGYEAVVVAWLRGELDPLGNRLGSRDPC